ncbi:hypothetical protein D9756_009094 [Leucocoprinus leucothites]|uniref:Uncharacterized protein n=1 Tax=Leucocoprinus leucothites TaxID=201217 RepID=A0A8H5D0U9_9AGAR|nr:hypothetical protein D9756_009094 [Leucoagaricus leucothites]
MPRVTRRIESPEQSLEIETDTDPDLAPVSHIRSSVNATTGDKGMAPGQLLPSRAHIQERTYRRSPRLHASRATRGIVVEVEIPPFVTASRKITQGSDPISSISSSSELLLTPIPASSESNANAPPLDSRPLFSTCDKVSISEICHDVENLNAAISDIVYQLIHKNSLVEYETLTQVDIEFSDEVSPLAVLILQGPEQVKDRDVRDKILDAFLHNIILNFVYDHVVGQRVGFCQGKKYASIKPLLECVERNVPFQAAQWWRSTAYSTIPETQKNIFNNLAKQLFNEINECLLHILVRPKRQTKLIRRTIFNPLSHLRDIIYSAYTITTTYQTKVMSERLELICLPRLLHVAHDAITTAHIFDFKPELTSKRNRRQLRVLGNVGFGLVGETEDPSSQKVYIQPSVAAGIIPTRS